MVALDTEIHGNTGSVSPEVWVAGVGITAICRVQWTKNAILSRTAGSAEAFEAPALLSSSAGLWEVELNHIHSRRHDKFA